MLTILKLICIVCVIVIVFFVGRNFFIVGKDFFCHLTMLSNSSVSNFKGMAVSVNAVVSESTAGTATLKSKAFANTTRQQPVLVRENSVTLIYEVDGINYIKEIDFVDVHSDLKAGDVVELLYDSEHPCNAVMADGSDAVSAKNGLKWDAGMAFIALLIALIVFLKMSF